MITAYPLTFPPQFPRTKNPESGRFKTSLSVAIKNVQDSLRLFATDSGKRLEEVIISSNVTLGVNKPRDAGVAVWFKWDGLQICIPVDRYSSVEANLQAIHHILEARRVELRHGTLALVRASFQGFLSLPAPRENAKRTWREVFEVSGRLTLQELKAKYKYLASQYHPDKPGGSHERMSELNQALSEAEAELG